MGAQNQEPEWDELRLLTEPEVTPSSTSPSGTLASSAGCRSCLQVFVCERTHQSHEAGDQ